MSHPGWTAYDAGLRSVGQRYYVGALRSARTAGDDAFGAFVLAEMGVHVAEAGRTAERVGLITTAIDNAPRTLSPYTQSFLLPAQGRGTIPRRRPPEDWSGAELCRFALGSPHGGGTFGLARLVRRGTTEVHRGQGPVALGPGGTRDEIAGDLRQEGRPRDKAVRSSRLAEDRLAGSDLDGALGAVSYGADLLEDKVSSVRALDRLKGFSEQLQPHKSVPAVREFRERLQALPVTECTALRTESETAPSEQTAEMPGWAA